MNFFLPTYSTNKYSRWNWSTYLKQIGYFFTFCIYTACSSTFPYVCFPLHGGSKYLYAECFVNVTVKFRIKFKIKVIRMNMCYANVYLNTYAVRACVYEIKVCLCVIMITVILQWYSGSYTVIRFCATIACYTHIYFAPEYFVCILKFRRNSVEWR